MRTMMGKHQGLKEPRGCLSWGIKEGFLEETEPYLKEGQKPAVRAEETAWANGGTPSQGLWELEVVLLGWGRDFGCFGTCCHCCESHTCTWRLVGGGLGWAHPSPSMQHTPFANVQGPTAFVIELTGHRQGSITGLSYPPVSLARVPADHVQGQVLLPDLLGLPPLGELPAAAAEDTPRGLGPAPRLPDLRALEADLHGDHRRAAAPPPGPRHSGWWQVTRTREATAWPV